MAACQYFTTPPRALVQTKGYIKADLFVMPQSHHTDKLTPRASRARAGSPARLCGSIRQGSRMNEQVYAQVDRTCQSGRTDSCPPGREPRLPETGPAHYTRPRPSPFLIPPRCAQPSACAPKRPCPAPPSSPPRELPNCSQELLPGKSVWEDFWNLPPACSEPAQTQDMVG